MKYPIEIIETAEKKLEMRRDKNKTKYEQNIENAFNAYPELMTLTKEIKRRQAEFLSGKVSAQVEVDKISKKRQELLKELGIPNLFDRIYTCKICKDTGIDSDEQCPCRCYQKLLREEMAKRAGFGSLNLASFDDFNLDYYDNENIHQGFTMRQFAEKMLKVCKKFEKGNILFTGATGLGKTFTAECIANEFIKKNKVVCYLPATRLFLLLDDYKFGKEISLEDANKIKMIYSADLMIIDDLGAEFKGPFSAAMLFDIINARLMEKLPTVISTNLTMDEIKEEYSPRIYSRIIGEYEIFKFFGDDIREKKRA